MVYPESSKSNTESTENELLRAYVSSLLETTSTIDKFTAWLLTGIGAVSSFLIINIKSVSEFISLNSIRLSLLLLAFSFFCCLCQKALSLWLHIDIDQESKLRERFKDIKDRGHGKIIANEDGLIPKVINRFRELHPWLINKFICEGNKGIDLSLKKRIQRYYWQYFWVCLSLISFLSFMLILSLSIKIT